MISILADSNIPFLRGLLEPVAKVTYLPAGMITRDKLSHHDALIIRTRTRCDESLLKDTTVKFIGTATIGMDHIDTRWCESVGIRVVNAPGCNSGAVMQYITSALVHITKLYGETPEGTTVGIVGAGNVGKKVIKAALALGMKVLVNDPPREETEGREGFVSLQRLAAESDIISFHTPLTSDGAYPTRHLGNRNFFSSLKKGTIIINSSRGGVIDEEALKNAICRNIVAGAVIDTWEGEPRADAELVAMCDIATPHIAGYSLEGKRNAALMIIKDVAGFFNLDSSLIKTPEPLPGELEISLSVNREIPETLNAVIKAAYDIEKDSNNFRSSPGLFEEIRNSYPVRREFSGFRVTGSDSLPNLCLVLEKLGFNIADRSQ
ncbi:MAG: 4-phosphoerythronate dehydrogenase [Bacteroidales bacterium]|nr:4-phosphoerythronate dehydrogenase [Bacteroidales bacterium]